MADQKISTGNLFPNFLYHNFLSGIRSFFSKSSTDIQEDDDVSSNNTDPVPSLPSPTSDIETQMSPDAHDSYMSNLKSSNISSPALESSSTPQGKETDHVNQNSKQTALHPIIWNFRNQELGRHVLVLAIPMIIALSTSNNPKNVSPPILVTAAVALSIGVALIWNGILVRKTLPKVSNWIEILGVAFILLSFYRFVASFLPPNLIWIPVVCWLLSMLPFAVAYFSKERVLEDGDTIPTSTKL